MASNNVRTMDVKKFTSKLVNAPNDPPINKVGYYFTRREMDQLDNLYFRLKKIMRDKYGYPLQNRALGRSSVGGRGTQPNMVG